MCAYWVWMFILCWRPGCLCQAGQFSPFPCYSGALQLFHGCHSVALKQHKIFWTWSRLKSGAHFKHIVYIIILMTVLTLFMNTSLTGNVFIEDCLLKLIEKCNGNEQNNCTNAWKISQLLLHVFCMHFIVCILISTLLQKHSMVVAQSPWGLSALSFLWQKSSLFHCEPSCEEYYILIVFF